MTPRAGRVIAWVSFALGILVSVLGNVLHSAITPAGLGELVGAAFWPLALMLSIEILTRVRWQLGRWWMAARVFGLLLVGIVAAILSYRHLAGLMTSWGEDPFNAHLGPLAVDGLMLLAATALLSISKENALPEEWQGTPEEISRKAFDRGVKAEHEMSKTGIPLATERAGAATPPASTTPAPTGEAAASATGAATPAAAPALSKLHVVNSVSETVSEEAARQMWIQSGGKMSAREVGELLGVSKATAHRKYTSQWQMPEARRIER